MKCILPVKIKEALEAFKAREMQEILKKAQEDAVENFKIVDLPELLKKEFHIRVEFFATSEKGEEYILNKWGRGLMDYRNAIFYYNPQVVVKEIDQHFPKLFKYEVTKGEVLLKIEDFYFPDPPNEEEDGSEGEPDGVTASAPPQS